MGFARFASHSFGIYSSIIPLISATLNVLFRNKKNQLGIGEMNEKGK